MEGDDGAGNAGDRCWQVRERIVHAVVVVGRRRVVVGDNAEVISGAARRRRPVVRRTIDHAVGERHPLADGAVLDDVVVGSASPLTRVDVRLGTGRRSRLPAQQQAVAVRRDGQVVRLRRSLYAVVRLERVTCDRRSHIHSHMDYVQILETTVWYGMVW